MDCSINAFTVFTSARGQGLICVKVNGCHLPPMPSLQSALQRRQIKSHIPVTHSRTLCGTNQVGIFGSGEKHIWVEAFVSKACTTGSLPSTFRIMESDCASTNIPAPNFAPSASMDSKLMPEPISCASSTMKQKAPALPSRFAIRPRQRRCTKHRLW